MSLPKLNTPTYQLVLPSTEKKIKFTFSEKVKRGKEVLIWLDDKSYNPLGVIIKKVRG